MHTLVENMVRGLNDLPVNMFWTATAKKVEDAEANEFLVPEMQGKKEYGISMKMASLMTSYGFMRTELHEIPDGTPAEGEEQRFKTVKRRVIYWEDTGTIRGKDRTTRLCPYTVNATLQQIRRATKGDLVRANNGMLVKPTAGMDKSTAPVKATPAKKAAEQASPKDEKPVESKPGKDESEVPNPEPKMTVADKDKAPDAIGVAVEVTA